MINENRPSLADKTCAYCGTAWDLVDSICGDHKVCVPCEINEEGMEN